MLSLLRRWLAIETRSGKCWRPSGRSSSGIAGRGSEPRNEVVFQLTTWLRRCAWPPSRRCRATGIRDDRSWPSSTASPRTRLLTPTAPLGVTSAEATDTLPDRPSSGAGPEQMAMDSDVGRPDGQAAGDPAREAARDRDPARRRRHERRGDRRGGRQHRGRRPCRTAPRAGAVEGRDRRDGDRPMPDFGRWTSNGGDPSLNEINRVDRFIDALALERDRSTRPTPTRQSWRSCSPTGATTSASARHAQ